MESNRPLGRRGLVILCGLVPALLMGVHFSNSIRRTEALDRPDQSNLVLGRIAFIQNRSGQSTFDKALRSSGFDGAGTATHIAQTVLQPQGPSWSPDGTRIAYTARAVATAGAADVSVISVENGANVNLTNTPEIHETNPSWSVTGKIAYERENQIWTMNADGSSQAVFAAITVGNPRDPSWSPDGSMLAFHGANDIWVINADGSNQRKITTNSTSDNHPTWSPDGTKIAFARDGIGLAVINLNGTGETPLTSAVDMEPAWSQDGTKIAFKRGTPNAGLYVMDADGSAQIRIFADTIVAPTPCCDITYTSPAWQPIPQAPGTFFIGGRVEHSELAVPNAVVDLSGSTNATTLTDASGNYFFPNLVPGGNYRVTVSRVGTYFNPPSRSYTNLSSNQTANFEVLGVCNSGRCARNGKITFGRNGDIMMVYPDGSGLVNLTDQSSGPDGEPNWSLDGTRMAFSSGRDGGDFEIYVMNGEGDLNPAQLTNNTAGDFSPNFSPDGSKITFISTRDGGLNQIYLMDSNGANQVRLTNNSFDDSAPAFSPDGKKIVFVRRVGISVKPYTMNADGTDQQEVPGFAAGGIDVERPSYSPDGKKIIFTYTPDTSTTFRRTWTMNSDGSAKVVFPAEGRLASYSPDGERVVYSCCSNNPTNQLRRSTSAGTSVFEFATIGQVAEMDWQGFQVKRATFDFDGDGRSDPAIFRASSDDWWYLSSATNAQLAVHWGQSGDKLVPADYDGDRKTDIAVWRPSNGNFYIFNSFDGTFRTENFGLAGDVPTGGDFDGDNRADVAVYRAGSQSTFYYRGSMGNPAGNITFIPWGLAEDKPVVGDYDGDGRTDAATFRPSNGTWYIRNSSDGQLVAGAFGLADDKLVPADYDGDGRTDLGVFRNGAWYLYQWQAGFSVFTFGLAGDIPVAADFDGDGRADASVFRQGTWWMFNSSTSTPSSVGFGISTDAPVHAAYVR